jgi:hypothetical protein
MDGFYRQVASRMVRKEMIPQELSDGIQSAVQLTGPAALLIQPADTLPVDTLELLPELPLQVE